MIFLEAVVDVPYWKKPDVGFGASTDEPVTLNYQFSVFTNNPHPSVIANMFQSKVIDDIANPQRYVFDLKNATVSTRMWNPPSQIRSANNDN